MRIAVLQQLIKNPHYKVLPETGHTIFVREGPYYGYWTVGTVLSVYDGVVYTSLYRGWWLALLTWFKQRRYQEKMKAGSVRIDINPPEKPPVFPHLSEDCILDWSVMPKPETRIMDCFIVTGVFHDDGSYYVRQLSTGQTYLVREKILHPVDSLSFWQCLKRWGKKK